MRAIIENMKVALTVTLFLTLAACSTTPLPIPLVEGNKIVVLRDAGNFGAACRTAIAVDGKRVASLGPGQTITLDATPGEHQVVASLDESAGLSGLCTSLRLTQIIELKGKPVVLRVGATGEQGIFERVQ